MSGLVSLCMVLWRLPGGDLTLDPRGHFSPPANWHPPCCGRNLPLYSPICSMTNSPKSSCAHQFAVFPLSKWQLGEKRRRHNDAERTYSVTKKVSPNSLSSPQRV
eukprot:EG_transcript_40703